MAIENDSPPDVDALVAALRERVAERRRAGAYPASLEDDLDAHFERIVAHRPEPYDFEILRAKMGALDHALGLSPAHIQLDSGVPGGTALHRAVGKAVSRQTQGILEQVVRLGEATREVLREFFTVMQHPNGHAHPDLVGQIDAMLERLVDYERSTGDPNVELVDLRRRLEQLEKAEARRTFRPFFAGARFEEEFRGSREEIRDRYTDLANQFKGCDPVVDLGCGRGEFVELLGDLGIAATGVDIDAGLIRAAASDLDVQHADAVDWLSGAVDGSLGGISLIQVVEHLTPQEVTEVVVLAARKLRTKGKLVIETLNPQSLYIFARAFYADPTHDNPIHPAYLTFLLREAGFSEVAIEWRSVPSEDESLIELKGDEDLAQQMNANIDRLNRLLFAPQDYAVIAAR